MEHKFVQGQNVRYKPTGDLGVVKMVSDEYVFVVYGMDMTWEKARTLTSQATRFEDLEVIE